jgi:hypothetical protein
MIKGEFQEVKKKREKKRDILEAIEEECFT